VSRRLAVALMAALLTALLAPAAFAATSTPNAETPSDAHILAQAAEAVTGVITSDSGPITGVAIVVTDLDGTVVGNAVTDDEGRWLVELPASGQYQVTIDAATLPESVALRDPDRTTLTVNVGSGRTQTVQFQIGEEAVGRSFGQRLASQIVSGIRFGMIIAITAIGLSLIYGTTGLVNFAHGELVTLGAVIAWFLNAPTGTGVGLPLIAAGLIAAVATAGAGGAIELGLWRPLRRRRTGLIQMLVISIGLMLTIRHLVRIWFGGGSRTYYDYAIQQAIAIGPIRITPRDLIVMTLALIVLVGIATMLTTTRIGKAMRAVSDNRDLAESSGIDVQRVILIIWILGGGLAGFGGVLAATMENVSHLLGFRLLLVMFAGVILGGIGTAYGALLGALVVGLVTEVSTLWLPTELKLVWSLIALIVILLVRPQGLLGRRERVG